MRDFKLTPSAVGFGTYGIVIAVHDREMPLAVKMPLPEGWTYDLERKQRKFEESVEHIERDTAALDKLNGIDLVARIEGYMTFPVDTLDAYGISDLFPSLPHDVDFPILVRECMGNKTMLALGMRVVEGEANQNLLYETVRAIHERGIANLDLHGTQNVAINGSGRPKLFDFGTAISRTELPKTYFNYLKEQDLKAVDKLTGRQSP